MGPDRAIGRSRRQQGPRLAPGSPAAVFIADPICDPPRPGASPGNWIAVGSPRHQAILHPAGSGQRMGQPQSRRQQHHRDCQPGDRAAAAASIGLGHGAPGPGNGFWSISGLLGGLFPPALNQIINRAISLLGYFGGFPARRDVHHRCP